VDLCHLGHARFGPKQPAGRRFNLRMIGRSMASAGMAKVSGLRLCAPLPTAALLHPVCASAHGEAPYAEQSKVITPKVPSGPRRVALIDNPLTL
jgi:hypothetical protein